MPSRDQVPQVLLWWSDPLAFCVLLGLFCFAATPRIRVERQLLLARVRLSMLVCSGEGVLTLPMLSPLSIDGRLSPGTSGPFLSDSQPVPSACF